MVIRPENIETPKTQVDTRGLDAVSPTADAKIRVASQPADLPQFFSLPPGAPQPKMQGPQMKLINKEYWKKVYQLGVEGDVELDEIYGLPKNRPTATVKDLINAMGNEGNGEFINGFPGHHQSSKKDQGDHFDYSYARHEIAHISARIAHSPQQEFLQLAFEGGLAAGPRIKDADRLDLLQFSNARDRGITRYINNMKEYTDHKPEPVSGRDWAIYTAAGMYLREKIDRYLYEQRNMNAQQKRDFCADYRLSTMDANLTELTEHQKKTHHDPLYLEQILSAPAGLVLLSKEEWRAIEAVALGMCEPEQTSYPKRLQPIKEALIHTHLFFDRPKFAEELTQKKMQQQDAAEKGRG